MTREKVAANQRLLPYLALCFPSSIHTWSGSCLVHPVELAFCLLVEQPTPSWLCRSRMSSPAGLQIFEECTASAQIEVSCGSHERCGAGTDRIGFGGIIGAFVGGRQIKWCCTALAKLSLERLQLAYKPSTRFTRSRM